MSDQDTYYETIHRYLKGELGEQERIAFEKRMDEDEQLRQDVSLERKLLRAVELAGDQNLKRQITAVHEKLTDEGFFEQKPQTQPPSLSNTIKPKNVIPMKRILAIAAAVLLLTATAWWLWFSPEAISPDEAYAKYYKPERTHLKAILADLESFGMVADTTAEDSLREALLLYDNFDYDAAIEALDNYLLNHPDDDTARLYLGLSHLNQSRYTLAAKILSPLSIKEDFSLKNEAKWYLGLCYLKFDKKTKEAIQLFEILAVSSEFERREEAKGMLLLLGK